tara:strand:+ start:1041 stop:1286 length:246 start_codon:yes stop_codon:yes gene_type:complete
MNIIKHITDKMPMVEQVVVEHNGNYYLVSTNKMLEETLAFKCESDGEPIGRFIEVAGGKYKTIAEVMVDIEQGRTWSYDEG